jgi:D-arabinose 5-phosphate isomerase GutQ
MRDHTLAEINIDRQIAALQNLYDVIHDSSDYDWIVDRVTEVAKAEYTRRVMIAGVGKNSNIASKISETMASLGIPSFYLNVSHCGHGDFGFIGHNDVIIHISRSGTTREMVEAIKHIRLIRPQVQQFLIHCKPTKPLNDDVDIELCIGAVEEGDEHGLAPTTSTTALLCILDCIAVQVSHNIGFERLDFLKFHPDGALGAMLKQETDRLLTSTVVSAPDAAILVERIDLSEAAKAALTVKGFEPGMEFR